MPTTSASSQRRSASHALTHSSLCPPPLPSPPLLPPQLKKLYADSREDMEASLFVPATAFNCDSREPEAWSFYLPGASQAVRRMLRLK